MGHAEEYLECWEVNRLERGNDVVDISRRNDLMPTRS